MDENKNKALTDKQLEQVSGGDPAGPVGPKPDPTGEGNRSDHSPAPIGEGNRSDHSPVR